MAVTQGHGNPNWNREETLLALDLFFRLDGIGRKSDERISELSQFLKSLPYHQSSKKNPTFRNTDGVYFKLQNLRSALTGEGLDHTSGMDRLIVTEFGSNPNEVARLANLIRTSVEHLSEEDYQVSDDFEEEFYEGKTVFALHRRVEREKRLRKHFLSRLSGEELQCAICGLTRPDLEREIHESLFEIHHVLPFFEVAGTRKTKLSDVVLLCASCHRAIHKMMHVEKGFVSVAEAKHKLARK